MDALVGLSNEGHRHRQPEAATAIKDGLRQRRDVPLSDEQPPVS